MPKPLPDTVARCDTVHCETSSPKRLNAHVPAVTCVCVSGTIGQKISHKIATGKLFFFLFK